MSLSREYRADVITNLKTKIITPKNIDALNHYICSHYGIEASADELTSLWDEYTSKIQLPSAAAASASLFGSRLGAPGFSNTKRSLVDDAIIMLNSLKQQALVLADQPDIDGFNWASSDDDNKRHTACKTVRISIQDSGHERERFYAIGKIIEFCTSRIKDNKINAKLLNISCQDGCDFFGLNARHTPEAKSSKQTTLMAPIAIFPFDDVINEVNEAALQVFSNWQQDENDNSKLFKICDNLSVKTQIESDIFMFQEAYKEIQKSFSVGLKHDYKSLTIQLDKDALNTLSKVVRNEGVIVDQSCEARSAACPSR